jgi:hypothetical protein
MNQPLQISQPTFSETQCLLTLKTSMVIAMIVISGVYYWSINKDPFVEALLVLIAGIILIVITAMLFTRLSIRVDASGICIRTGFFPGRKENIHWKDIGKLSYAPIHTTGRLAKVDDCIQNNIAIWICEGKNIVIIERATKKAVIFSVKNLQVFQAVISGYLFVV